MVHKDRASGDEKLDAEELAETLALASKRAGR